MRASAIDSLGVVAVEAKSLVSGRESVTSQPSIKSAPAGLRAEKLTTMNVATIFDMVDGEELRGRFAAASASRPIVTKNCVTNLGSVFLARRRNLVPITALPVEDILLVVDSTFVSLGVGLEVSRAALPASLASSIGAIGKRITAVNAQSLLDTTFAPCVSGWVECHALSVTAPCL